MGDAAARPGYAPHIRVVALLTKAGANGGTFLLHDGPLVGNGLSGPHVADELLDCVAA